MIIKESDMLKLIGEILISGKALLEKMETKEKLQVHIEYDGSKDFSIWNFICEGETASVIHDKKEALKTALSTGIMIAEKLNEAMEENFCATVNYDTEKRAFDIKITKKCV